MHHGLFSASFVTPFLAMVGLTSARSDKFWRGTAARRRPPRAAHAAAAPQVRHHERRGVGRRCCRRRSSCHHDPHPWDDLWRAVAVEHPAPRRVVGRAGPLPLLERHRRSRSYLGCDWENVPLHLPSTFTALDGAGERPERADGAARRVRPDLAVGEPARRGAGLVRPLAQGPRHRHPRRPADPLLAARRRRVADRRARGRRRAAHRALRAARRRRARRRRGRRRRARDYMVLGHGTRPARQAERDRPAVACSTWTTAPLERGRSTSSATSSCGSTPRRPRSTRRGSSRCRTSRPTASVDRRHRRLAAGQPARGRRGGQPPGRPGAAVPRAAGRARRRATSPTASRSCPTPDASHAGHRIRLVLTSDDQDPRRARRSWASATRPWAPAASTPSSRARACSSRSFSEAVEASTPGAVSG